MLVLTVKTSQRSDDSNGSPAIPVNLTIELSDDGNLKPIIATDDDGREYDVRLKLHNVNRQLCCCPSPSGKWVCFLDDQCPCDPV